MSSRGPVGTSSRLDLFQKTPRSSRSETQQLQNSNYDELLVGNSIEVEDERIHREYGLGTPEDSPVQLDRVIGYSGDFRNTVKVSPGDESLYIRGLGCLLSFENMSDSSQQKCLRSHDMTVSAIDVSASGALVASGQVGSKNYKGYVAPVFVWHATSHRRLQVLKGLTVKVNFVSFSPDERFICAGGEDCVMYIWDIATTEVIYCSRYSNAVSVFSWVLSENTSSNYYEFVFGIASGLQKATLTYDPTRVLWSVKVTPFALTSSINASRSYLSLSLSIDNSYALVGTTVGEMLVFRKESAIFRVSIPVCSNGLQCIVVASDDSVLCGGGDGSLKKLRGCDLTWSIALETSLDSAVKSISLSPNQSEAIVACASGTIYRCLLSNFSKTVVQFSHASTLTAISFNYDNNYATNLFVTGSCNGELRVWDISDYAAQAVTRLPKSGRVNCVKIVRNEFVVSGWEDGFIRCHDAGTLNRQLWFVANAHRGAINSVDVHYSGLQYLVSGGTDSIVRVWKFNTRELINQCTEHKKSIQKVVVDKQSPNIIHSIGLDGSVLSYDLKTTRRIMYHMIPNGSIIDVTQRKDNEQELITCDTYGRLVHWDIDYRDPVKTIQDPSRKALRACSISPSGRFIAFGGDDEMLKVMEVESSQIIALGQGHSATILVIAWTPDERQVLTSGDDGCLCVWNFYLAN